MQRLSSLSLLTLVLFATLATAESALAAPGARRLTGEITGSVTLGPGRDYVLSGTVVLMPGASLHARPGTVVRAEPGAVLVVGPHATLVAAGTRERPVVFTSASAENARRRGDWGGIVFNGRAPAADAGDVPDGLGAFGGRDPRDDQGRLRFVRIEYAGANGPSGAPLAGLALRGVGSGTLVDSVEVLNGAGDGVAIAGGAVRVRRIVSIGNLGTAFSWSSGWDGRAQYLLAQARGDGSRGGSGVAAGPGNPEVRNVTLVGGASGVRISAGARGSLGSLVVMDYRDSALDVDDVLVEGAMRAGSLQVADAIFFANRGGANVDDRTRGLLLGLGVSFGETDPGLANPLDEAAPNFRPRLGSAASVAAGPAEDAAFFEPAPFTGAFGPGADDDWTAGWASFVTAPEPRYLANSAGSIEALTDELLDALAARDVIAMKRLRVAKNEFCWYVYPELTVAHVPNVSCDWVWSQATLNSLAGLDKLLSLYGGQRFERVAIEFPLGTDTYEGYTVHKEPLLTVRDEHGELQQLRLFGSILEMRGQYKLFSFVID